MWRSSATRLQPPFSWLCSRARLSKQEVRPRLRRRVGTIELELAVDEHLLGQRVHAERRAVPDHHVAHLAGLERARELIDTECARRIRREPADRMLRRDVQ